MDVYEVIQTRKSTRNYESTPVPKETLEKILEAGRIAPSAVNIQPWHFIVVTSQEKRKALSKGMFAHFLASAPVVVALCSDEKASSDWYAVDASLAGENIVLAATAEGLGTCWVGSFEEENVRTILNVPLNLRVIALLAIGYAKDRIDVTSKLSHLIHRRKSLEDIVSWESYDKKTNNLKKSIPLFSLYSRIILASTVLAPSG
jgi:nitroreductase